MSKATIPTSGVAHQDVESLRRSLVTLRRMFQRKELAELWAAAYGEREPLDYGMLRLLDAVRVAGQGDEASATVGAVGQLLGVDPSRASRMVARAVEEGLVERRAAPRDGRVTALTVTPTGARLQARGAQVTRARIASAVSGWPAADRTRLARLLERLVRELEGGTPAQGH